MDCCLSFQMQELNRYHLTHIECSLPCSPTHTLWNSRIGWIRPLILWGLCRGDFEAF
jgi:hypothetical protein